MSPVGLSACLECGAPYRDGKTCREKFDEILALEFESPATFGAVHHITVICYNLQHPARFTEEALKWMESTLSAIVEEGLSPEDLRREAREKFKGDLKILHHGTSTEGPRRAPWSVTVLDIHTDDSETYIKEIAAWAKSMLGDLHGK